VIDRRPRQLSGQQLEQLKLYAELVMREIDLRHSALRCPVTGLYERALFFRIGEKEVKHARERHTPLALINVDIDNFRQVNNRWGHEAGDQVLLDFASLCRQFVKEGDVIARIGDEEFGLLLIDCDGDQATSIAETLRQAVVHMPGVFTHSEYRLHISGGVTDLDPSDGGFVDLFHRAAKALELAKNNGRNQITRLTHG
jgi:diguanylate cyclase (GGDEF)-like protein